MILQPRFPRSAGGRPIRFLRVLTAKGDGVVLRVTSESLKEASYLADCMVEVVIPEQTYKFTTGPGSPGHRALCRLLRENGVKGSYLNWFEAKEAGGHPPHEYERRAIICFEADVETKNWKDWTMDG